jgi:hypothetical protein
MTSEIDSLIEEVDQDMRKDRALALARRYGPYAIALALGVTIAIAGVLTWKHFKTEREMERSGIYAAALEAIGRGDTTETERLFGEMTATAPSSGYGVLARLQDAGLKAKAGDAAGAAAIYDALASDSHVDPLFRDLGTVLYGLVALDTADPAVLDAHLKPLADGKGPWRFTAIEIEGYLALKTGNNAGARDFFSRIANDANAPEEARARAAAMASTLGS